MDSQRYEALASLNFESTLGDVIRALYHVALDYCVLRSSDEIIGVSKDCLIALHERGYSERRIKDIMSLIGGGICKHETAESFKGNEDLDALIISDSGCDILTTKEAFAPDVSGCPDWWSVPLPLGYLSPDKVILNNTASAMSFASQLSRVRVDSIKKEEPEFFVSLKDRKKTYAVLFRRLADDVYLIEDVTQDVAAAGDIAWWASIGKVFAKRLEDDGKHYWRSDSEFVQGAEMVYPCEWDGKSVGFLCISSTEIPSPKEKGTKKTSNDKSSKEKAVKAKTPVKAKSSNSKNSVKKESAGNEH